MARKWVKKGDINFCTIVFFFKTRHYRANIYWFDKKFGKGVNVMNKKSANKQLRRRSQFCLKPVYAAVLLAFAAQTAQANPVGGSVVNGSANFATSGSTLTVTNTPGTIINWQGFSIGSNEVTRFAQQSASSTVLNRVVGSDPSSILGTLQSNGRVFLVNPNGILFGAGAVVDVAGLVASTLNLSDADFKAGNYHFTEVPGAANISNAGNITAQDHGQIYLIAPNVENTGAITAPNGEILLAAGYSVDLVSSDDPNLRVNITAPAGDATNIGQLIASSGSLGLYGTVVSNSGVVSADSATLQGGKIVFKASQRTEISGTVSANGTTGGNIEVLGNQVAVMDGATVSADGTQGGGTVLIGGDAHGANPDVQNAQITYVAPTAAISADAVQSGNGGKVVVWADNATQFDGNISARGGAISGNGGWVEVSGRQWLGYAGLVNTTAANGMVGSLLLDPTDITIGVGTDSASMVWNATTSSFSDVTLTPSTLNINTLVTQLGSSNVTVDTTSGLGGAGNITIADSLIYSSPNTLTLSAAGAGTIGVNANTSPVVAAIPLQISISGGGSLVMQTAGGSIGIAAAGGVTITGGGSLTANADGVASDVIISSVINTGAGAINLTAGRNVTELTGGSLTTTGLLTTKSGITTTLDGANVVGSFAATNTGGGTISLTNTAANWTLLGINQTGAGAVTLTNSGIITPTGAVNTGSFTLSGGTWDQVSATLPGFTANTGFNITGATFIRALGGDGSTANPYQLADIYGVQGMGSAGMLGNSYVLANNIDASVTLGWLDVNGAPVGFAPVGNVSVNFTGQFDGQGHAISNLTTNNFAIYEGLFGVVGVGGMVSNVGLIGSSVIGACSDCSGATGALAGYNQGTVSNSYASNGSVSVGYNIGGLVGSNAGTIINTYASGVTVSGGDSRTFGVGGLVGYNTGSIVNSYASNSVVSLGQYIGGLVGYNAAYGGIGNANFWNTTVAGAGVKNGIGYDNTTAGPSDVGAAGLTTAGMMTMSNFTNAGWDISISGTGTVWRIAEGLTMPQFSFMPGTITVTLIDEIVDITNQREKPKPEDLVVALETPGTTDQSLPMCN